ncbi:unnamed protein product [Cuscuta epithymum]|uniref:RNase H type-1 domain-containing protein n=1 Tax=Cuscuta epithymum TaxID=186058 RepID=A0AAV0D772_9ASTE|nr:unnamed protein product [Cuscuta epithymum]
MWKRRGFNWQQVVAAANSMLQGWREAQLWSRVAAQDRKGTECWSKPPHGVVKINVDTALDSRKCKRAWGWLARDSNGNFLKGGSQTCIANWPVSVTEAIGVREALVWAKRQGWSRIVLETDSLTVVSRLLEEEGNSYLDMVIEEIRRNISDGENIEVYHCKRSANRVAHSLAREALAKADEFILFNSISDCILSHLANDCLN